MSPLWSSEAPLPPGVVKEVDGVFASFVVAPISVRIVRRLLDTPVTPNHVTIASFGLRILAAYLLLAGTWAWNLLAAVSLLAGFTLDMVDGQLARARGTGSNFGAFLDKFTDRVSEVVVYGGAAAGVAGWSDESAATIWPLAYVAIALVLLRSLADEMVVTQLKVDAERDVHRDGTLTRALRAAGVDDTRQGGTWIESVKRLLWFSEGERLAALSIAMLVLRVDLYFWLVILVAGPSWILRLLEKLWRLR